MRFVRTFPTDIVAAVMVLSLAAGPARADPPKTAQASPLNRHASAQKAAVPREVDR